MSIMSIQEQANTKQTALITGASRGIGKAIATTLAKEGYHLHLTCVHSIDLLTEFAHQLENSYGIHCIAHQIDMSDYTAVASLFETIKDLDILINNAGISHVGLLHDMSFDEWHRMIDTNLSSVFYTCKHSIPILLKKQSGRIINISSVWGNVGASMEVAYSAAKGGMNSFTKALAKELAPSHICVNAIACGIIDTDMNKCFSEEDLANVCAEIPSDRMGQPEEVAKLVLSLLNSPEYLTGQIITMDGGWT